MLITVSVANAIQFVMRPRIYNNVKKDSIVVEKDKEDKKGEDSDSEDDNPLKDEKNLIKG